ncbi:MAG: histidine kinase [Subdoligranulum sp.]|nr:histidine kinase [Subdoligranulum sp.]
MQQKRNWFSEFLGRCVTPLRRIKIQSRLLLTFLAVSLVPVVFIGLYAYRVYTSSVHSKVGEYTEQSVKLLNKNLELEIEKYSYYIDSLSVMDEIQHLFASAGERREQETRQIHYIVQKIKDKALAGPYLREIQIVSLDSELLYSSGYERTANTQYKELLADIDRVSFNDSLQYVGPNNLVLGRKIYRYTTALEPIGYILVYINAQLLSDQIFSGIDFGSDSTVFLMSSPGTILVSNNSAQLPNGSPSDERLYTRLIESRASNESLFNVDENEAPYLAVYNYNPDYDCYFVATVPNSYIQNETRGITTNLAILSLILFIASFAVTLLVYYSIVLPIKHIISCCNVISDEDLDKAIDDQSPDEVGFLARTLDALILELKEMSRQWQKDQTRKRELELESLRYQINPHFLFNTLNSLKWVASLNEVPVLYNGIESLSVLLQSTLIKSEEFIPLKEEIKNLSHYFSIQKIRYGDCFDDVYNIDERLRDYQVPRFILQPLAENAVLHGTHGGEQIVRITISAHIQGSETIVIAVQDDGKGFDMHNAVLGEHFSGIGISNVDERLRLYYGNEYGLSIESRPGLGTTCWIRLPFEYHTAAQKEGLHNV